MAENAVLSERAGTAIERPRGPTSTQPVLAGRLRPRTASRGLPVGADAAMTVQEMAELFSRNHSPGLRAAIARECAGWSAGLARGIAKGSSAESDDLAQVALMAVLAALDRYDPAVGDFEPYARATVAGEVRHHLRATEWSLRVPRRLQEAYRYLAQARDEGGPQAAGAGAAATAASLGFTPDQLSAVLGLRRKADSLDAAAPGAQREAWLSQTDSALEAVPERIDLSTALARLDPLERRMIGLYFFNDATQREVARALGTSQPRVFRILDRALSRLREELTPDGEIPPCARSVRAGPRQPTPGHSWGTAAQ